MSNWGDSESGVLFFCLSVLRAVFVCNRIVPVLKPVLNGVAAVA